MRIGDIRINGNVGTDRLDDNLCIFGKISWECDYHPYHPIKDDTELNEVDFNITKKAEVVLTFDGLPCNILIEVLNAINVIPFKEDSAIAIPGIRIIYKDMTKKYFSKAMRDIFGLAIASIPSKFIEMTLKFKEEWE